MKRVLLIDDDTAFTSTIVRIGSTATPDLLFTVAHTADAGIGLLAADVDCLVVDLKLGVTLGGFRVLDARRKRRLCMPAIVVSAHLDAKTALAVQRLDAALLPKGAFAFSDLEEMIRNPPVCAYPAEVQLVEILERERFTYSQAKALPLGLFARVYERERSISGTAEALDMSRQSAQDVLKRQLPRK